ncbi:MAG: asparagine synthase (glutamine-hydrolyzing) [Candidatus Methanofastidiosa archaeon]|nr:asparagine synthase (glutamine-hydrolyzing) [Candidatus Methanofastidiosa archaeon]
MCGICGIYGDDNPELLKKMMKVMGHRGPDEEGSYEDKGILLGHKRLSIIDLSTGSQPIYNEDNSVVIIFSGEIYNFQEIRSGLEKKGHKFYTNTDTEVIVHLYEEKGVDCLKDFNGMYAFAIWDSNKKRLFIARDPHGMKPLYYYGDGKRFLFASEVKAILQDNTIKREVDINSFHFFCNLRYLPRDKTILKGIKKLESGSYLLLENGKLTKKDMAPRLFHYEDNYDENYWLSLVENALMNAVRRHLISDVPVGINLSGGIDSSLITAFAAKISDAPVKTFCMGFGEADDEIEDARKVSDYYDTEHRDLLIKSKLAKDYPMMIWYADTPKRNLYPYYLTELTSKYVKVALGGLGGDELFGGYTWKYEYANRTEEIRKRVSKEKREEYSHHAKKLLEYQIKHGHIDDDTYMEYIKKIKFIDNDIKLYLEIQTLDEVFTKDYLEKIYGNKIHIDKLEDIYEYYGRRYNNNLSFLENILLLDYSIKMVDDFIFIDESMAMGHSLEGRIPFLDKEIVDISFKMPFELKYKGGVGKYILKKLAKKYLPQEVLTKPKKGFGSGVFFSFNEEIQELCKKALCDGNAVRDGFVDKDYIDKIIMRPPQRELVKHYSLMWSLLSFEVWYNIYIKEERTEPPKKNIDYYIG